MTFATNGLIQAADYNLMVTGNGNGVANTANAALNTFWAVGNQNKGYGHAITAAAVAGDTIVAANKWANLINHSNSAHNHTGSTWGTVTVPVSGGTVAYMANLETNISNVFSSRLNAASQGSTTSNTVTYGSTWTDVVTATHTVTFDSGDAARYFFNAGGQIAITASHPTGAGIDASLSSLAANIGTVVLSSVTSGSITIAGTGYNGITKIAGGGAVPTISTNSGYYALTTSNVAAFSQITGSGPSGYDNTAITINIKSNGTQGSNGDAGSVITIYTIWDEVPNGLTVSANTATTVTIRPPETTNISNNWGAITLSGTVSGA